jgi:hypothetical protein
MSKGIGRTQQAILELVEDRRLARILVPRIEPYLTCMYVAKRLDCSPRQARKALHSLADRGLVQVSVRSIGAHQPDGKAVGPSLVVWMPGEYEADQARCQARFEAWRARREQAS